MSVIYRNPPLLELIVELRWGVPNFQIPVQVAVTTDPTIAQVDAPSLNDELLFSKFSAVAATNGFGRSERVIPAGFPIPPYNVVVRFRPTDIKKASPLYQLGNGVFSANALPPYKSWQEFCPKVLRGLEMMEQACKELGHNLPTFNTAIVRYIDVFREDLTKGMPAVTFIHDVLGLGLQLPEAITKASSDPDQISPMINLKIPVEAGILNISLGQGIAGGSQGIVMDSTLVISKNLGNSANDAIRALTNGRGIIHEIFRGMTTKLHRDMQPED